MESINKAMAQRVWDRVQNSGPSPTVQAINPEGLVLEEITDAQLYRQLGRQNKEWAGMLSRMAQQAQMRADVLRGICRLSGLIAPTTPPAPRRQDNPQAALRLCIGCLLRRLRAYEQMADQEEFGPLYKGLAQNAQDSALLLAQVAGK